MARRVQRLHLDTLADGEYLAMTRGLGDLIAVLATDDGEVVCLEDFSVAACMVVVA